MVSLSNDSDSARAGECARACGRHRCASRSARRGDRPVAPASARSATNAWRCAVPAADQGSRPISRTVSAASRISSARRRPCWITRWKKYVPCRSQSMPGKVSRERCQHGILDAVGARGGEALDDHRFEPFDHDAAAHLGGRRDAEPCSEATLAANPSASSSGSSAARMRAAEQQRHRECGAAAPRSSPRLRRSVRRRRRSVRRPSPSHRARPELKSRNQVSRPDRRRPRLRHRQRLARRDGAHDEVHVGREIRMRRRRAPRRIARACSTQRPFAATVPSCTS